MPFDAELDAFFFLHFCHSFNIIESLQRRLLSTRDYERRRRMTKRTQIGISVLIIAAFIIARQGFLLKAAGSLFASEWTHSLRVVAFYAEWLLFIILASLILNRFRFAPILHDLGLTVFFKRGLLVAFLATLPMLIGYVFIGHLNENLSVAEIMQGALLPGFMEELLFRGFLFGLLFRRAGWGFLPAAAVSAILFAAGHLYQSSDLGVSAGIFFT